MAAPCSGKERDAESGNDFFGARSYYSGVGRWLSVDPVLRKVYNPQRLNRYSYAMNDPINYVDPDGGDAFLICPSCEEYEEPPDPPIEPIRPTGPIPKTQDKQPCWARETKIELTFLNIIDDILQLMGNNGFSSDAINAVRGVLGRALQDEMNTLFTPWTPIEVWNNLTDNNRPSDPYFVGGHFNLIVNAAGIAGVLSPEDYARFVALFGGSGIGSHNPSLTGEGGRQGYSSILNC